MEIKSLNSLQNRAETHPATKGFENYLEKQLRRKYETSSNNSDKQIEFECYYIQLSEQISKRNHVEMYFDQAEMWYLIYCLAQSADSCHKINQPIGKVSPEIVYLNKEGKLKILSKLSLPQNIQFQQDHLKKDTTYSPEQLQNLKKSYKEYKLNYIITESFSIGMTLLAAGTLQKVARLYDYQHSQLNKIEFNKLLSFWHQNQFYSQHHQRNIKYSEQLKGIVIKLLQIDPELRLSILDVYERLKPHQESIMNLTTFQLQVKRISPNKEKQIEQTISKSNKNEAIHVLRSRRKSSFKAEQNSNEKNQISNIFNNSVMEFSFNPNVNGSLSTPVDTSSPIKTKKLTLSLNLAKQQQQRSK